MSHVIRISAATYEKLGRLARPFVDTSAAAVVDRCVDAAYEAEFGGNGQPAQPGVSDPAVVALPAEAPGELKHTRPRRIVIGSQSLPRPNWNALVRRAHSVAIDELGSIGAVRQVTRANVREGRYEEDGYAYVRDGDFSIQGLDSNLAWESSLRLAKEMRVPLRVEFVWLNKDGAAHPGQKGLLEWTPDE